MEEFNASTAVVAHPSASRVGKRSLYREHHGLREMNECDTAAIESKHECTGESNGMAALSGATKVDGATGLSILYKLLAAVHSHSSNAPPKQCILSTNVPRRPPH